MTVEQIKEAQSACIELIKTLELSKTKTNKDDIYENLKVCLHNVNVSTDKIFDDIIFGKEEKELTVEG